MDQIYAPEDYPKWLLGVKQALGYLSSVFQVSSFAGSTSMPFPSTCGGKYSGKNLAVSGARGSSGVQASNLPSKTYDWHHKGQYKAPGKVVDDSWADLGCSLLGSDTCKKVSLRATPNQVLKAMKYAEDVHKMGERAILTGQVDDVSLKDGVYKMIDNNCVDFVINLINKVGNVQWIEHLREPAPAFYFERTSFQGASRLEQIQFMAWNYLSYASWRDS